MPDIDDARSPDRAAAKPSPVTRRSLLGAAGAGAAGIAAASFMGAALPAAASTRAAEPRGAAAEAGESEPVVVHVRDAATGEMDVFRGTTHTRVRDRELAARLVRASR